MIRYLLFCLQRWYRGWYWLLSYLEPPSRELLPLDWCTILRCLPNWIYSFPSHSMQCSPHVWLKVLTSWTLIICRQSCCRFSGAQSDFACCLSFWTWLRPSWRSKDSGTRVWIIVWVAPWYAVFYRSITRFCGIKELIITPEEMNTRLGRAFRRLVSLRFLIC